MPGLIKHLACGAALALGVLLSAQAQQAQQAQQAPTASTTPAAKGPPAGFVAPAEPAADESNAQRARTQPGNNAPIWRMVRESGTQPGVSNLPGAEMGTLIQPFVQYPGSRLASAGEAWRQVRNNWIIPYGGALLLITLLTLGLVYLRKGAMGGHLPETGRLIERFTPLERVTHWCTAISFVVLAVSGIVMAFGKFFLLPVLGATLFGWLSYALKTLHNFAGPVFAVALVIQIVVYLRDNLPRAGDLNWLARGGGLFAEKEIPSHRFNAGEKAMYWAGLVVLGLLCVGSGLVLDKLVPGLGDLRGQMQVAHLVHAISAVLMMGMFFGHIYMGSVGVKGALEGMKTGYVDEAWAKEHHELWYDDIKAGKIPAQRSASTAPSVAAKPGQA